MLNWILSSSVLILGIIGIRALFQGKMKCRLQYMLWGLVLLRLLIPFSIGHSGYSVSNVGNAMVMPEPVVQESREPVQHAENVPVQKTAPSPVSPEPILEKQGETKEERFSEVLVGIWLAGALVMGTVFLYTNLTFQKRLLASRRILPGEESPLPVYVTNKIKSPCLFGIWKPSIYVTEQVSENSTMLRHTLAHELCHHRHGDHIWSVLRGLCLTIHWYNPLVWWAAVLSQRDAEMACDEDTIKTLGEAERMEYGSTLIQVTCQKSSHLLTAATTMTSNKKVLKQRITSIARKPRNVAAAVIAVLLLAAVFVGCTFTGAKPSSGEEETTQEPTQESIPETTPETTWNQEPFDLKNIEIQEESQVCELLSLRDAADLEAAVLKLPRATAEENLQAFQEKILAETGSEPKFYHFRGLFTSPDNEDFHITVSALITAVYGEKPQIYRVTGPDVTAYCEEPQVKWKTRDSSSAVSDDKTEVSLSATGYVTTFDRDMNQIDSNTLSPTCTVILPEPPKESESQTQSMEFPKLSAGASVPEGCTYKTAAGETIEAGSPMPAEPSEGDVFTSQQFVYTCRLCTESWDSPQQVLGWGVSFDHVNKMRLKAFTEMMYEEINGLKVLSVRRAFADFDALEVTPPLPNTITDMSGAFMKCLTLEKVTNLPGNLQDMTAAFYGCSALKEVPDIPGQVGQMGMTFQFCENLEKTPDYSGCQNLAVMDGAFQNCSALKEAVPIPGNVAFLNDTFSGCTMLQGTLEITAKNLVPNNCKNTLKDCTGLTLTGSCDEKTLEALASTGTDITIK